MPYWGINNGTLYLSDTETTYANESFDWPSGSISASTWPWHSERSNILNVEATALNTSNATSMAYMFNGCEALTDIDINDWDVSNIVDMQYMFYNCTALTSIDMGDWDTSNVTNMSYMFEYCGALTSLNLRNWTVDKVADFSVMFVYCTNLTTIYCNNDWSTNTSATGTGEVFYGCSSLVGAISYDATKKGLAYANPTTGYFTIKTVSNSSVSLYLGIDNLARPSSSIYVGVNGVARKVIAGYVGVNGVAKSIYSGTSFPVMGKSLNEYTWAEISAISQAGLGSTYFSIGDTKAVHIKGTVGTLEVDDTFYVYIIGFDHNGATNTIDFGTFKTANGVDVCLVDSKYESYSTDGTKYFNMNHSSDTNSGGWKSCDLRYDVLGSTNTDGDDAGATTATSPVSGTLMAALPSELRAVMKPMTIYTDNTGGGSDTASYVTATVDYLPPLAEFEIFGTRSYANSAEQNYQAQYAYYSAGNSKKKYRHSAISSARWWERSPYYNTAHYFCAVSASGSANGYTPHASYGLAPIFRV